MNKKQFKEMIRTEITRILYEKITSGGQGDASYPFPGQLGVDMPRKSPSEHEPEPEIEDRIMDGGMTKSIQITKKNFKRNPRRDIDFH